MAGDKYIIWDATGKRLKEVAATQTSGGAGNAGDIVALNSSGEIDSTMLPTSVGAETTTAEATEALAAGDWVHVWDDSGNKEVRKASAASANKFEAHGFVLDNFALGVTATIYHEGLNNGLSGLTNGEKQFLSASTAGASSSTAPTGSGDLVQKVGVAANATTVSFEPTHEIELA